MHESSPVITIDGPSGSGKGTLSRQVATALGWHFLDSGALYRILALAAQKQGVDFADVEALQELAANLDVKFIQQPEAIMLSGEDVSKVIRTEQCAMGASKVAAIVEVRQALLRRQRAFLQPPGLVADGRDMGTVVFEQAKLKIFLEASPQERAKRRQAQLKEQGIDVSLDSLFSEISQRDARDRKRSVSPLKPAADALVIDTTRMSIKEVFEMVMEKAAELGYLPES